MPAFYVPVQFPPKRTGDPKQEVVLGSTGQVYGAWRFGNAIYAYGIESTAESRGHVYRSLDDGQTFETMDAATSRNWGWPYFDPANHRIVVAVLQTDATTAFADFDLLTNTWGAVYGAGGPDTRARGSGALLVKSSGDRCIVYEANLGSDSRIYLSVWNGSWSVPQLISTNFATGVVVGFRGAQLEPASQNIHVIYGNSPVLYYRVRLADGSLSAITDLTGIVSGVSFGCPLVFFKSKVYIANMTYNKNYYVAAGTPAAVPSSFTQVFVAAAERTNLDAFAFVSADGNRLIYLYTDKNGDGGHVTTDYSWRIYKTESTDGSTWSTPVKFFDFWPSWYNVACLSATDIGTGGADGIGAVAQWTTSSNCMFFMLKLDGAAPSAIPNHAY